MSVIIYLLFNNVYVYNEIKFIPEPITRDYMGEFIPRNNGEPKEWRSEESTFKQYTGSETIYEYKSDGTKDVIHPDGFIEHLGTDGYTTTGFELDGKSFVPSQDGGYKQIG